MSFAWTSHNQNNPIWIMKQELRIVQILPPPSPISTPFITSQASRMWIVWLSVRSYSATHARDRHKTRGTLLVSQLFKSCKCWYFVFVILLGPEYRCATSAAPGLLCRRGSGLHGSVWCSLQLMVPSVLYSSTRMSMTWGSPTLVPGLMLL